MPMEYFEILGSKPLPRYLVTVEYMSGDADASEYCRFPFDNPADTVAFVKMIATFQKHQKDRDFDIASIAADLGWSIEDVDNYIINNVPWDVTNDDVRVQIDSWKVVFYADNIEYELRVL